MPESHSYTTATLRRACRLSGIQPSYINSENKVVWSTEKSLLKVLGDLHEKSFRSETDLQNLSLQIHQKKQSLPPVHVAWGGESPLIHLYTPSALQSQDLKGFAKSESGEVLPLQWKLHSRRNNHSIWKWQGRLPLGYFDLQLQTPQQEFSTWVISPPPRLENPPELAHSWGPFLPLYAVKSDSDLGMGSLKQMGEACQILKNFGCRWAGTLPLLAGDFDRPDCDPSPYSSLTRLFWNEIYLDLEASAQFYQSPAAQKVFSTASFRQEVQRLQNLEYCDYYGVYQNNKLVLSPLSEEFFQKGLHQKEDFKKFVQENPDIYKYSQFRSPDPSQQRFHQFAQFEMNRQLAAFKATHQMGLYLDFPVGVNDSGFDFKEFRDVFFAEVTVGAPPEPVFRLGQEWGFPSFHPEKHRAQRYQYFIKSLRHHLKFASILRLDHVMGLFRVYAVPKGFSPAEGVYLRYPPEELFALAILEAHRSGADFVGENLGTVPEAVENLMEKRNIKGMWVAQMKMDDPSEPLTAGIALNTMTCFNTHDMPSFASFCEGTDLDLVHRLGILTEQLRSSFKVARASMVEGWQKKWKSDLYDSALKEITESPAQYFVLNMEDLWNELQPQNIPGTFREYPNWRKKFKLTPQEWADDPIAAKRLEMLRKSR